MHVDGAYNHFRVSRAEFRAIDCGGINKAHKTADATAWR